MQNNEDEQQIECSPIVSVNIEMKEQNAGRIENMIVNNNNNIVSIQYENGILFVDRNGLA